MKILSIGNFGVGWDGSICDEAHIADSLESIGHEVVRWQRENALPGGGPLEVTDFDLALIAQWDGYDANLISELREYFEGIKVVYWAFDYQEDGQEWHERLIKGSDLYLSKPFRDSKYKNWRWLSQDFAPMFLDKMPDKVDRDIDILFTGSWVPWESGKTRVSYLEAIDAKFNLHIYSVTPDQWKAAGFKNVHGPVMDDALPALIARAKINFSMDHVYAPGYWSDRNAQIMACGGYVLFRHVPMSEATFGAGVDYFYDLGSCLKKIEMALSDDNYRDFVAQVGYQQAHYLNRLMVDGRVYDFLTIVGEIL